MYFSDTVGMKCQQLVFLFFLLLFLGCTEFPTNEEFEKRTFSSGKFDAESEIDPNDSSHYLTGCKEQGAPEPELQIDSRLSEVGKIERLVEFGSAGGSRFLHFEREIVQSTPDTLETQVHILKSFRLEEFETDGIYTEICSEISDGKFSCSGTMPALSVPDLAFSCQISVSQGSSLRFKGNYKLGDGTTVPALQDLIELEGEITCAEEVIGSGVLVREIISSNEIPSDSFDFCGGTQIMFREDLILEGDVNLFFQKSEILGINTNSKN